MASAKLNRNIRCRSHPVIEAASFKQTISGSCNPSIQISETYSYRFNSNRRSLIRAEEYRRSGIQDFRQPHKQNSNLESETRSSTRFPSAAFCCEFSIIPSKRSLTCLLLRHQLCPRQPKLIQDFPLNLGKTSRLSIHAYMGAYHFQFLSCLLPFPQRL